MKRILIFSCRSGGGHTSVARALEQYLSNEYEMVIIQLFEESLEFLDPIKLFSRKSSAEDFYNFCLQKKYTFFLNISSHIAAWWLSLFRSFVHRKLKKVVIEFNPDMIISVIPFINGPLLTVTQELQIPFLLIPTDLDATNFIKDLSNITRDEQFLINCAFEDQSLKNNFIKYKIPENRLIFGGFPLRADFFMPKNVTEIKNRFHVPPHKPVILLMMGAAGADRMYDYITQLSQLDTSAHLLICIGKNEKLREKIQSLNYKPDISITIIGHTDQISDLMAIADIAISKAGTVSVCELIYMCVPILVDNTSTPLLWEKFNLGFIQKKCFGEIISDWRKVNKQITKLLHNQEYYQSIKNNLRTFKKQDPIAILSPIIHDMIQQ